MSSVYPMYLEKLAFVILLGATIMAGDMLSNHLSGAELWLSWVCGLPLALLVVTEAVGRIIQTVHIKK